MQNWAATICHSLITHYSSLPSYMRCFISREARLLIGFSRPELAIHELNLFVYWRAMRANHRDC
jgi:hypothetical protein